MCVLKPSKTAESSYQQKGTNGIFISVNKDDKNDDGGTSKTLFYRINYYYYILCADCYCYTLRVSEPLDLRTDCHKCVIQIFPIF